MLLESLLALALALSPATGAQTPGVHGHLLWDEVDTAEIGRQLDAAAGAGAGIVRVDVGWSTLEAAGKGHYDRGYLAKMDTVVTEAQRRGLRLLFTFWTTPCWASSAPAEVKQGCEGSWWERSVDRYAPSDARDYAEALAFLVRRYGDRVAAWELWNEPNHVDFLKSADQVAAYATMVKAAYPAAKRAGARTVIAGSLADADFEFTERLYRQGLRGNFDAYSVHPYSGDRSPRDRNEDRYISSSFIRGVPAVRDVMLRNRDVKPLWLTEFGWSTCTKRDAPSYDNCVDEATQSRYLKQAFAVMRSWSYVPVGIWFGLEDTGTDSTDRVSNYGLIGTDDGEKRAYAGFVGVAAALAASGLLSGLVT
ncbi:MAG: cellulase family glycosylhydrolase [Solirubrobacteraceae bacterium]